MAQLTFGLACENQGLFADHFLTARLAELVEHAPDPGVAAVETVRRLYRERAAGFGAQTNEAQTEHDLIRPVLDVLWGEDQAGDSYQVQVSLPGLETRRPDYALFGAAAGRAAAEELAGTAEYWSRAAAVGDAKRWLAALDRSAEGTGPSAQIADYLWRSNVRWGVLTNGRYWRLYEQDKARRGGVWFQVDLEAALEDDAVLRLFCLCFGRWGHLAVEDGPSFLTRLLEGSARYATEVGDQLKERVYDALGHLINGFLEYPRNRLDGHDPATLALVHDNALVVLYRLLFLLYAEDRRVLPAEDDKATYRRSSLLEAHQRVKEQGPRSKAFNPRTKHLWKHLTELFEIIDEGFPDAGMPPYNGGLFAPERFPQIAHNPVPGQPRWDVGDRRLAQVLFLLAYEGDPARPTQARDIDYATLEVQHLGTIYEGLLELQPRLAEVALVETGTGAKATFKPAAEVPKPRAGARRIAPGEVYLVTDRGERKATGSYYTPSYIVDYIVEQTVGPLVASAAAEVAALRPAVDAEVAELSARREHLAASELTTQRQEAAACDRAIAAARARLLEPYLGLKLLDPAMGSGHFLVGAADFLSFSMANDPNLPAPPGGGEAQAGYKRLVVERCLYGVDLNPLAVELAKLSLWLHTVSRDQALSFLDHHLRCGNSLIGARLAADLSQPPPRRSSTGKVKRETTGQYTFGFSATLHAKHLRYLLDTFRQIAEATAGDAETERAKAHWYAAMDAVRDRFRQVANLWLAPYFGVAVSADDYAAAVDSLRDGDRFETLATEPWFVAAQEAAHQKRFFHWELEFPEAFLSPAGPLPDEQRGFDAVMGNPPYVRPHRIDQDSKSVLWNRYAGYERKSDILNCFIEAGIQRLQPRRRVGLVTSDTWRVLDSAHALRGLVLDQTRVVLVRRLPHKVFAEASVTPVVVVLERRNGDSTEHHDVLLVDEAGLALGTVAQAAWLAAPGGRFDIGGAILGNLRANVAKAAVGLGALCGIQFGLKTGDDNLFTNRSGLGGADRPLLTSGDVSRYGLCWSGWYVDYRPAAMRAHRTTARPGEPARFEAPKLIVSRMAAGLSATLDRSGLYVKDALLVTDGGAGYSLAYVLAVLNSALLNRLYQATFTTVDTHRNELLDLPIRRIAFITPTAARERLLSEVVAAYEAADHDGVLTAVTEHLGAAPERADVVHDLLAHLAERMVALNQTRQAEVTGFLTWLEGQVGAAVDDLVNKTTVRAYHDHDYAALREVLRRNRAKLTVDPDRRQVEESLRAEFDASVAKLAPLKERLAATDALIDQIVYRLYDLTDDEIALVEGA